MRFLITSVTGKKGYKSFKNLNEYVDFMTKKGHLIKNLQEAEVPYTEKPVKMVKATQSKGWEEVSDFGDVDKDSEKSASLIASTSSSVMKNEANMEFSKSSEKADKNEKGLGGESGDINMSDFKSFDYSEPELESSKNASKAQVEYKEVDTKETSESKTKEDKKADKKDSSKKYDKEIEECLKAAGVQLKEGIKDGISSWKDKFKSIVSKVLNKKEMPVEKQFLKIIDNARWTDEMPSNASPQSLLFLAAMVSDLKDNGRLNDFISNNYDKCISLINKLYTKKIGDYDLDDDKDVNSFLDESIKDYLPRAGVQLNEFFKFDSNNSGEDDSNEKYIEELRQEVHSLGRNSLFIKACVNALKKLGNSGGFGADRQSRQSIERFINEVNKLIRKYTGKSEYAASLSTLKGLCEFIDSLPYKYSSKIIDDLIQVVYDNCDSYAFNLICNEVAYASSHGRIDESIKDYLPRAGVIRDDNEDKNSRKMGVWGGQGTDEQLRKAKIIAKVKFANGDRMGRVTKADLDNFDEYKAQYDEIYGSSEELEEGWKDKLKKGAATLGVAGALAGSAMANDTGRYDYNFDPNHYEEVDLDANDCRNPDCSFGDEEVDQPKTDIEKPRIKRITKNGMIIDQFGHEWTREDFDKLLAGKDPFYDGARSPNIEESEEMIEEDDDSLNVEIAECLKAAGC